MHLSRQEYNQVMLNFQSELNEYHKMREDSIRQLYSACPTLAPIEKRIRELTAKKLRSDYMRNAPFALGKELDDLKKQKAEILSSRGIHESDLEDGFRCDNCKDTGYVNGKMCNCLKKVYIDYAYKNSNLKEKFKEENFDTFNLKYYSNEKANDFPYSPRDNANIISKVCKEFCDNFDKKLYDKEENKFNLILYGLPGLGKTFMCNCIAKEVLDKCYSVIYYSSGELEKIILNAQFNYGYDQDEEKSISLENVYDCDLLIIDDLGTEPNNQIFTSELFNIINSRVNNHRPTIISTNLNMKDLQDKYTERISSRISGTSEKLKFFGENIREIKK